MAKLYYYYGTMFSAKSAKLLIMVYNFRERGLRPLVLTSGLDDRFGEVGEIHSRIPGLSCKALSVASETDILELADLNNETYDIIVADEVQFFTKKHIDQLASIVDDYGVNVFCFGLRSNYMGELFPSIVSLMAKADTIREIKTVCRCGQKATMNALLNEKGELILEGSEIVVGDKQYGAFCRKCYNSMKYEKTIRR